MDSTVLVIPFPCGGSVRSGGGRGSSGHETENSYPQHTHTRVLPPPNRCLPLPPQPQLTTPRTKSLYHDLHLSRRIRSKNRRYGGDTLQPSSCCSSSHQVGDDAVPGGALDEGLDRRRPDPVGGGGVWVVVTEVPARRRHDKNEESSSGARSNL